jgi:hypothetical protein
MRAVRFFFNNGGWKFALVKINIICKNILQVK